MKTETEKTLAAWRSLKVYDAKMYDEFLRLCKRQNTTVTRALNGYIARAVDAKEVQP